MAEIVGGLFGVTPESLQLQREQQAQQEALAYAQLSDPFARANYQIYKGASGLGRQLSGLLGAQDPEMQKITQRQALLKQAQPSDAEGWKNLASQLWQAGDVQGAQDAMAKSQALQVAKIDMASKLATAAKASAEAQNIADTRLAKNARVAMLTDSGVSENEAQGIASSDSAFAKYIENKKIATPPEYAVQAQLLGFNAKPYLSDYTPDQVKAMEKGVFGHKAGIAAAGRSTTINQQESAFSKELGTLQAKDLTNARTQAVSSAQAINTLAGMEKDPNLYGGPMANATITGAQFLRSLNLLSPEETQKLANSEVFRKDASKLVLADLGGKLGAQVSDSDRKFIEGIIPQLQNSPEARQRLINKMKEIHQSNVQNYQEMQAHANKYNNLNTFDPTKLYGYKGTQQNKVIKLD